LREILGDEPYWKDSEKMPDDTPGAVPPGGWGSWDVDIVLLVLSRHSIASAGHRPTRTARNRESRADRKEFEPGRSGASSSTSLGTLQLNVRSDLSGCSHGLKPCLRCKRPTRAGSYCERCGRTSLRGYGAQHQRRARLAIAEQPWCSICGATSDLTADHLTPIAVGGHPLGPLRVLCPSCNSRRGSRLASG
jgi:5-methylcytosine-specific restriction endonuclease McrA